MRASLSKKRIALIGFGVLFIALFAIVGIAIGIGNPSVPSGDVAVVEDVPDGTITVAEFQKSLQQTAARQGVKQVPSPSSPQYSALRDSAMSDVLLSRWVRGEAEERGITVSDTQITNALQQTIKQQFGGQKQFQQFLKQAHFTEQDARDRIALQQLSNEIQKEVLPTAPTVSSSEIKDFYEANKSQFQQPETRDVREIVNKDQAKVEQAKTELSKDNSAASWKKVASALSTDQATKDSGGLRKGVTKGQSEPALDQEIFAAPQGQLVGPFKGQSAYYLIEVDAVTPAKTVPLSTATTQIKQALSQGKQQEIGNSFQQDFVAKWTTRTFCAKGYVMSSCENFTPPPQTAAGAAPVTSSAAVNPGTAGLFPGQTPQALPQGPITGPAPATPQGLPQGIVPQGATPPGAAPPGTAPGATTPGG